MRDPSPSSLREVAEMSVDAQEWGVMGEVLICENSTAGALRKRHGGANPEICREGQNGIVARAYKSQGGGIKIALDRVFFL